MNPNSEEPISRPMHRPIRRTRRVPRSCALCGRPGCNSFNPRCPLNRVRFDLPSHRNMDHYITRFNEIRNIVYNGPRDATQSISVAIDVINGEPEEECGICYESSCNVTTNCGHKYCQDCFQKHFRNLRKPCCAFCRSKVTLVKVSDVQVCDNLNTFVRNVCLTL